jgi:hypothetical protein
VEGVVSIERRQGARTEDDGCQECRDVSHDRLLVRLGHSHGARAAARFRGGEVSSNQRRLRGYTIRQPHQLRNLSLQRVTNGPHPSRDCDAA